MARTKWISTSCLLCLLSVGIPNHRVTAGSNTEINTIHLQTKEIRGRITDTEGSPLESVTVTVRGTSLSTASDEQGQYTLSVPSTAEILVISLIGYETQELQIGSKNVINVSLSSGTDMLEEVVVVGYGTMQKKDLTGAITQLKPDDIADENPRTVQDILRGTPGLTIGLDASAKNGGSINIRGQRSVYTAASHNSPLLILDGMIFYGELSEINPDDIEQIDVLKDASAAAVYGAQSANGVIIITTKKGKQGKPKINFTSNFGLSTMGANRPVWGPDGYLQYREDFYKSATYDINPATGNYEAYMSDDTQAQVAQNKPGYYEKLTPGMLSKYGITEAQWRAYSVNGADASDEEIYARRIGLDHNVLANYLAGRSFDWYDHSFRDGFNQDYSLSVSGASDKINYYMSAGYLDNEGVIVGDNYRAVRSNLKVDGKITDWLNIGANINFQDRSNGNIATDWNRAITSNSPFASYRDEDGNLEIHPQGSGLTGLIRGYNYDFNRQFQDLESGFTVLNSIFTAKVKLPFNITYSFNAAPRYQFFHRRYFASSEHPDWNPLTNNAGVERENTKRFDWSLNHTLNWEQTFAEKHRVNVTLVQEVEERQSWMDVINARNIKPTDALGLHETSGGDKLLSEFDSHDVRETADGMLARLFYSYDDKYMFTGSVRRDGYSAFGSANPRATFLSAGLAWTFTRENFFNWTPMSNGKLRLSYGQNGNRSLESPYIALANLANGAGTQGYLNAGGDYIQYQYLVIDRMENINLQWEKTASFNIGLDLGFLDNRITTTLDYFQMSTTDMIMNQSLPDFAGFSSITTNLGEVQNNGFEISVNSQNITRKNFSWNTTFGFSKYKNSIKHLYYQYEDVLDADGNVVSSKELDDIGNEWFIGQPISAIWDYRVTGIWQVDEIEEAARYEQRPGDPIVANNYTADDKQNADGTTTPVYNDNDKEFLGQSQAPIMWSLRNDFAYKNFTFSFNMYSYWGGKSRHRAYLNQDNGTSTISEGLANTYEKQYWTPENPSDFWSRLESKGPSGLNNPQRLFDRSFIRLDNISLGYTFPSRLTLPYNIEKLKVFGSIRNAVVWHKDKNWQYWDIETGQMAPRIFTFGVNIIL
ncbi:SusC/RagA family TonB-linked outer membrane protein [Sphingobacterium sp. SGR-19]|uniref:SusC/RagA family TonB-linked outer membrane protein n=1 Tax=Sphingobacterium sp. SGR-19 TaxID=2710886 RepID=UPI0013ED2D65|nr:SusC/RagA family TonB-linked outer membrane protein [Sphingobacterium sp. SGR-19]NGM66579.1 SusC/RagA family TonB-linked outer membrane protein [Sphingobacterium sp. SGR-19]